MRLRSWLAVSVSIFALAGFAFGEGQPESGITVAAPGATPHGIDAKHDKIWSCVIMATSVSSPKETPAELKEYSGRLKKVFGYNQFEIIGSATEVIDELTENWLVPCAVFPLSVKARRSDSKEARGGYLLNLRVFQDKRPLVDTEAKLAPGSPLFIRGPLYGKGQLIILLQVQH